MELEDIELSINYQDYTPPNEIRLIVYYSMLTSGKILEVGCNKGTTTYELATYNPDREVIAIDYTDESIVYGDIDPTLGIPIKIGRNNGHPQDLETPTIEEFGCKVRDLNNVVLINQDSKTYEYDEDIHFIFIDADHTYEGVKADTDKALEHINKYGGTIVWHDYYETDSDSWVGVKKYLDELELDIIHIPNTWLAMYTVPMS
jgi:SAM-dependent methyltransferase